MTNRELPPEVSETGNQICSPREHDLPVRIAFCITELDPGGAERALVRIVTGLDPARWRPHVFCLAPRGPLAADLEAAGIPVTCLGACSKRDVRVVGRLANEFREFRPEILQTFLFHANLAGRIAARRAGTTIVVSGARVIEPDARWRMRLDLWTSRMVDRTVCVSRGVADRYRALGFRDDQLAVVPNGVDVERFATAAPGDLSKFGIPVGARTVLSIGRLHLQKGQRDLIAAFDELMRSSADDSSHGRNDIHLLLVGDGPDRETLLADVRRRGLTERVHFASRQPDVVPLLRGTDLFVLASRWEGMPNVLLEAMAAAVPCVATDVEGVAELIIDGETGLLAEPHNPHSLQVQMSRLLADRSLSARLAAAAQAHVRDHFTWEQTIRGFESVWDELLNRGKPAGPGDPTF